jgi:hypothetical protein
MSETLGCGHPDRSRACGDCLDEAEAEVSRLELQVDEARKILSGGYHQGDNGLVINRNQVEAWLRDPVAEKPKDETCVRCHDPISEYFSDRKAGWCDECEAQFCIVCTPIHRAEAYHAEKRIPDAQKFCDHAWEGEDENTKCRYCGMVFYQRGGAP